jgi:glycosyltransferase involved in cell wall biosynthesis
MTKIKVMHYLTNLGLGGTEKTCQLFANNMNTSDFDVYLAYEKAGDKTRLDLFKCNKVEVDKNSDSLNEVIKSFQIDIFHVYRSGFPEYPVPGKDINVNSFVETNVFGMLDRNPKINRSLFMSEWLMFDVCRKIGGRHERFDFVNNPVESPCTDENMRTQFPEDAIILGRCGRPDNGIYNDINVQAARILRLQGYPIHILAVAPPTNMVNDCRQFDVPLVVIEPTIDPIVLSKFYNTIDIYAHARADGETFGVNIAEAMIHSNPVVTHIATPSFPGMGVFQAQTKLVDDGITGFVVQNDCNEYAEALKKLIDSKNLRDRMGIAGLEKANHEFHVDACVQKLERIYKEVMYV